MLIKISCGNLIGFYTFSYSVYKERKEKRKSEINNLQKEKGAEAKILSLVLLAHY